MTRDEVKGYTFAAVAAAAYGTNPAFAVPLYDAGMNPNTVLLFRYLLGLPLLALMMKWLGTGFALRRGQILPVAVLGIMMALSSLTLFESYRYMNVGIASTLLFIYPVLVAVLMTVFFRERFRPRIALCLVLMAVGLVLLIKPSPGATVSITGCILVLLSALSYAFYIIMVNVWKPLHDIPTMRMLFYIILFGSSVFMVKIIVGTPLSMPAHNWEWFNLVALAVIPTVVSLGLTTRAIQLIGSTPTAILGALEPVSAVILGVLVLGQGLTTREIAGGVLILLATLIVVAKGNSK